MLRKHKAEAHGDMTARGEAKPKTGMDDMPMPEKGGSAGNRKGKPNHPSGKSKHDVHRIKGKVRHVHAEAVHGGHKVPSAITGKGGGYSGRGSLPHSRWEREAARKRRDGSDGAGRSLIPARWRVWSNC